jgi:hypothetical protein
VGSRSPLHDDQALCRFEHAREHVCNEHRGQVYFGTCMLQMRQREERSGSLMLREQLVEAESGGPLVVDCGLVVDGEEGYWSIEGLKTSRA